MPDAPTTATNSAPPLADKSEKRSVGSILQRAARALFITSAVVLSLLSFPSVAPWMIAFWLLWHTVARVRGKPGYLPLFTYFAILLVKRIYWAPSLLAFFAITLIVAVWYVVRPGKAASPSYLAWVVPLALWGVWGGVAVEWHFTARCNHTAKMDPVGSVVCLGDSLTSGVLPDRGYPEELKKLIRLPVVNLGQSGITTKGGLDRLPQLAEAKPQVVVIELGGHDYLKGKSRSATKKNLELLITACRKMGAEVVLLEIPRGFITDPFAGLEREIAHEKDLELIADSAIRQLVLWSPFSPPGMWMPQSHLSDDGIHTNARGSKFIARDIADALQRMYGQRVRSAP